MDQKFLAEMKEQLLQEQKELQQELDAVSVKDVGDHVPGSRAPKFPNYGNDALNADDDSPIEVTDFMENVSATGHLGDEMSAVQKALQAITNGTYGICKECGKEIGEERLRANSSAITCIACA